MTSFKSKIHPKIVAYFGTDEWIVLRESFKPGRGWRREAPRLSLTRIRQLREEGCTSISVGRHSIARGATGEPDRVADFQLSELT